VSGNSLERSHEAQKPDIVVVDLQKKPFMNSY